MSFVMRINFVDVIVDNSLKNVYRNGNKVGYEFKILLSDYRGEYLSCIDEFTVEVDGQKLDSHLVSLNINGKSFVASQFHSLVGEFWTVTDYATVRVMQIGGIENGDHDIKLNLTLRKPYLPTPGKEGMRAYVPQNSSDQKVLTMNE